MTFSLAYHAKMNNGSLGGLVGKKAKCTPSTPTISMSSMGSSSATTADADVDCASHPPRCAH